MIEQLTRVVEDSPRAVAYQAHQVRAWHARLLEEAVQLGDVARQVLAVMQLYRALADDRR